jgi:hypothetical protein
MIIETTWPAHVGEQFADGAFAATVGKSITVHDRRGPHPASYPGRVLSATVTPDGTSVVLRVEVEGDVPPLEPGKLEPLEVEGL